MAGQDMKAIFRCDASPEIGSGHVYRCMTLADELIARGWHCMFLSAPGSEDIVPALKDSKYNLARTQIDDLDTDILIVDHYELNNEFESFARAWAKKIVVIDDLADRAHDCDVLFDTTYGRNAADYKFLSPAACKIFTGPDYALLRPQFAAARAGSLKRRIEAIETPRILVSMGSTNIGHVTEFVLNDLKNFNARPLIIDVVLGGGAPGALDVKNIIAAINGAKFHTVHYHESVRDMAALMAAADVAIGAGGTTSWERCCLGLPAITIEIADNQAMIAKNLNDSGAIVNLGKLQNLKPFDVARALETLMAAPESLREISERAALICDGRGVNRIIPLLYDPIGKTQLRLMNFSDEAMIYSWQTHPETRKYFRNPSIPTPQEHNRWIQDKINDINCEPYIIERNNQACGLLRIDKNINDFEVSIVIAPEYYRQGIAGDALKWARILHPNVRLKAEIKPGNLASIELFKKAGYVHFGNDLYISAPS
jgi:UDP-2,4-diacetamido-2,4,6-trideoxy-beta-L-altropyranose hydrolase